MELTYNPGIFDVAGIDQAMQIILTPDGESTDERWRRETPHVADLIDRAVGLAGDSVVLDFGCGIGRMSRELIERHDCRAIGIDISPSMRGLAPGYVGSERFFCCGPQSLDWLIGQGAQVDAALSIWVLQHCPDPVAEIARLRSVLRPGGRLFVANTNFRCVPSMENGWINDGVDVRALLADAFTLVDEGQLDPQKVHPALSRSSYWAAYECDD